MRKATHLYRFGYTWPEELEWFKQHPSNDLGESSSMVFILASTEAQALQLGAEFAEFFVQRMFQGDSYSWKEVGFAAWIESDNEVLKWAKENSIPQVASPQEFDKAADALRT